MPRALAGDTLDVVAQFEIQSPDPATSGDILTRMGVAETLTNADPEGALTPVLASEWGASEDVLLWTVTLCDGVRFHEGSAMTAEAVARALDIGRCEPAPLSRTPVTGIVAGHGAVVPAAGRGTARRLAGSACQ